MPLQNFGSILNFAEELERLDQRFYETALTNPACGAYAQLFADLAAEAGKNVKTVQRLRREYVTEMILEPVQDFTRASFCEELRGGGHPDRRGGAEGRPAAGGPGGALLHRSGGKTPGAVRGVPGAQDPRQDPQDPRGQDHRRGTLNTVR